MDLTAGAACLDFVNSGLDEEVPVERLHTYNDLLVLTRRLQLLDDETLSSLTNLAQKDHDEAQRVLLKAREVRQSMLTIFRALAEADVPRLTLLQLETFNNHLNEALAERAFTIKGERLEINWAHPSEKLMQLVWIYGLSAYELLTTKNHKMVKQCGACAWLFLDETKNHGRKWCDMLTCGGKQKARRYYLRQKNA